MQLKIINLGRCLCSAAMHQQMLGLTQLLNPHSRSKDVKHVTPVYYVIGEGQYKDMQKREAGNERRGRGSPGNRTRQYKAGLSLLKLLM